MEKDEKYWDQNAFNDILLGDAQDVPGRTDNLLKYAVLEALWGGVGVIWWWLGRVSWPGVRLGAAFGRCPRALCSPRLLGIGRPRGSVPPSTPLAPPPPRLQPDRPPHPPHLRRAYKGSLLVGILPVSVFCSGQTYKEGLFRKLGLEPYVIHATFQFSGTAGKRHRLREWGAWKVGCKGGGEGWREDTVGGVTRAGLARRRGAVHCWRPGARLAPVHVAAPLLDFAHCWSTPQTVLP